jgi:hypothetical protein
LVERIDLDAGKCKSCGTEIAGVWSQAPEA